MAISSLYIPLFSIEEVILDKDTGLPLASGTVAFYSDVQQQNPKPVYQLTGTYPDYNFAPVSNPQTLGLSGTFVDSNGNPFVPYAYPYDAAGNLEQYYIVVTSSGGVQQFVRHAVPYVDTGTTPQSIASYSNELCNPNFVEINFLSGASNSTVITVSGSATTPVAPGWDIISSGSGTLTLKRLEPTAADQDTNPPYALQIEASSGLGASVTLRQRLNNSPAFQRGQYISGTLLATVISGGTSSISMTYAPSTGTSTTIIPSTSVSTTNFGLLTGNVKITEQVNTAASSGYVDINISIPTSRVIAISSIQIAGAASAVDVPFNEETADRQKDHLFHYYEDAVVRQPKADILAGWNFPLNPWQFTTTTSTNVAANQYTADQTIIIQQAYVASGTGNNVAVGRGTYAENYAFQIKAVFANNKVMMLNYVDPATARPYWGEKLSVRVRASVITSNGTSPTFKVRLMYKAGLPGVIAQTVPVSSWDAANDTLPVVSGDGWTYLTTTADPTYTLTSTVQDFNFDGFTLPGSTNDNMTLGVAFIMMKPTVQTGTPDVINIERISLVHNDFAIDASPMTMSESIARCQFYYEKSYNFDALPGAHPNISGAASSMVAANVGAVAGINDRFKVTKLTSPTIVWYSTQDGASGAVYDSTAATNVGVSSTSNIGISNTGYPNVSSTINDQNTVFAHWTAACRLGVEYHS